MQISVINMDPVLVIGMDQHVCTKSHRVNKVVVTVTHSAQVEAHAMSATGLVQAVSLVHHQAVEVTVAVVRQVEHQQPVEHIANFLLHALHLI